MKDFLCAKKYAKKYITNPNKYKDLKPKYIELYSNKPPNIAPRILEDNAIPTNFSWDNCFEKAIPEKNIGTVKIAGNKIFKKNEGIFVKSKNVT